jgi:DNA-directed RNA polymerase subunit omega
MIYPSADKIDEEIDSKYALVVLAAKRAKQLKEGARPLIDTPSTNPLTIALEEIARGQLKYKFDETSLAGREALADKEAVVGNRDLDIDGADPLAMPDDLLAQAASQLGADLTAADLGDDEEADAADEDEDVDVPLLTGDDESEGTEA